MLTFSGTDASRAVVAFFGTHAPALPDHTRDKLTQALAGTDWIGGVIGAFEALYAARADLPAEGIELLDGLARLVSATNFYGKGIRAAQISGIARRIAEGGPAEAEDDPAVAAGFEAPAVSA